VTKIPPELSKTLVQWKRQCWEEKVEEKDVDLLPKDEKEGKNNQLEDPAMEDFGRDSFERESEEILWSWM